MALEIERKFRVTSESWRPLVTRTRKIRQAYLSKGPQLSLRVRIDGAESAILTIKAAVTDVVRHEFEYFVPVFDAEALFRWRDGAVITKTRHIVQRDNKGETPATIRMRRPGAG